MNLETANKSILGLFFLYLVMMGGNIHSLLNCGLQKLLNENILLLHIIVFISIFIFTFILNWYTPSSLILKENFENNDSKNNQKFKYIINSFYNSLIIYLIFVLSTKQEHIYMYFSLIILIVIIGVFIIYKIEYDILNLESNDLKNILFLNKDKLKEILEKKDKKFNDSTIHNFVYIYNILICLYYVLIINMLIGVYVYYNRQSLNHAKNWSWFKFIFGSSKCEHVSYK